MCCTVFVSSSINQQSSRVVAHITGGFYAKRSVALDGELASTDGYQNLNRVCKTWVAIG